MPCPTCNAVCPDVSIQNIAAMPVAIVCDTTTPGGGGTDYELIQNCYTAIANGAGYSIGNNVTLSIWYDPTILPPTIVATTVFNNTTATPIAVFVPADFVPCATGGGGLAKEGDSFCYITRTAFLGASVGDKLHQINWYDETLPVPTLVATSFYNVTQQTIIPGITIANVNPCREQPYIPITHCYRAIATTVDYTLGDKVTMIRWYDSFDGVNLINLVTTTYYNNDTQTEFIAFIPADFQPCEDGNNDQLETCLIAVTDNAPNYLINDTIKHVRVLDLSQNPPVVVSNYYVNNSTDLIITAPTAGHTVGCDDHRTVVMDSTVGLVSMAGSSWVPAAPVSAFTYWNGSPYIVDVIITVSPGIILGNFHHVPPNGTINVEFDKPVITEITSGTTVPVVGVYQYIINATAG